MFLTDMGVAWSDGSVSMRMPVLPLGSTRLWHSCWAPQTSIECFYLVRLQHHIVVSGFSSRRPYENSCASFEIMMKAGEGAIPIWSLSGLLSLMPKNSFCCSCWSIIWIIGYLKINNFNGGDAIQSFRKSSELLF